jgi:hypothetical protein
VTAVVIDRNRTWSATTDDRGRYRFPALPAGAVRLQAERSGFRDAARTVTLAVGDALDVPLVLSLAGTSEHLTVSAEVSPIAVTRTSSSDTVTPSEVNGLPLNGRNYLDLALLVPGASRTNTGTSQRFAETSAVPGTGISISGQRNLNNTFIVDGVSSNDDAAGLAGTFYSQEVVREFQVVRSGGLAEFGRASSGVVNVVTNAGTNAPHGRAYAFFRDDALDARNAMAATKDPLSQQQAGVTASGPIVRDRTFLFGNLEITRNSRTGLVTIPSSAVPAINRVLDTRAYPGPRLETGSFPTGFDTANVFVRADHQQSPNTQVAVRYSLYDVSSENARGVGGLSAVSRGTALDDRDQSIVASVTSVLGSTTFNDLRAQASRSRLAAPVNDVIGPAVTIAGVANFGTSTSSPTRRDIDTVEVTDTISLQRGTHLLKAGGTLLHNRLSIEFPGALQGVYSFSSMPAFQAGRYVTYQQAFGAPSQSQSNPNLALFVQDRWQAGASLTVEAGLRYDVQWLAGPPDGDHDNFAPRLGLSWAPGDRKTIVRASAGRTYDRIPLRALSNALQRDGSKYRVAVVPFGPEAPAFASRLPSFPDGQLASITTIDPGIDQSGAWQAAAGVEHGLGSRAVISIDYEHLSARGLIMSRNINVPTVSAAQAALLGIPNLGRPHPRYANVSQYQSIGRSEANSLLFSVRTRGFAWGDLRGSYTLSSAMDDAGNFFFSTPQDNDDVHADWGPSDNDQRHRVSVSGTLQAPQGSRALLARALLGCQLSFVAGYASALPFSPVTGTDRNNDTNVNDRPLGVGRNSARGFDAATLDLRLARRVRLGGVSVHAMIEAFNVLDRSNLQLPNAVFGPGATPLPTFGTPTAAGDPRQLQLGVRVEF